MPNSLSLSLYPASMHPHHTLYWVVAFQHISESVEPIISVPIGVNFAILSPMLHHPVLSSSDSSASSGLLVAASPQTLARSIPSCPHHRFTTRSPVHCSASRKNRMVDFQPRSIGKGSIRLRP